MINKLWTFSSFRDYALAIMNKTERILGMLSKAAELQNSTAQMISVARANIGELLKLIEQVILEYSCSIFHVIWTNCLT